MNLKNYQTALTTLIHDVSKHPHKEELIKLMADQVFDDTVFVNTKHR